MKSPIIIAFLVIVTAVFTLETDSAQAQSIFLEPNSEASIHLEALRPGFDGYDLSATTFAFYLSGRFQVGHDLWMRTEFPFMNYKDDNPLYFGYYVTSTDRKSSFGNPYLGLDFGNSDNGFQGEAGFRVPVVKDYSGAAGEGLATDPVERMEAFVAEVLPIYLGVNYRLKSNDGFGMRLRMIPVFWVGVGDGSNQDTDVFVLYSAQAWFENETVGVGGGLSGRFVATGDADGFGERSLHQFGFFANFSFGSVMPGFQVRFPLDEDLERFNTSYSFSIGVKL